MAEQRDYSPTDPPGKLRGTGSASDVDTSELRRISCRVGPFTVTVFVDPRGVFRGIDTISVSPPEIQSGRSQSFDGIEKFYGLDESA